MPVQLNLLLFVLCLHVLFIISALTFHHSYLEDSTVTILSYILS